MPIIKARQCPYDPRELAGQSIGMFHCDACGCMVIAGMEHGPCVRGLCPAFDEGKHPGPEIDLEITEEDLPWLG